MSFPGKTVFLDFHDLVCLASFKCIKVSFQANLSHLTTLDG